MSEDEDEEGRGKRAQPTRSYVVPIDDLDLNTPDGQNTLIIRCQEALAKAPLNGLDLKIIIALKDSIKIKKDIDVLKEYVKVREVIEQLRTERRKAKTELKGGADTEASLA